jgi:hypothetical protein
MSEDPRAALDRIRGEVEKMREDLAWHRRQVAGYQARRDAAEAEARASMAKLAALDEEEKALRARFLNDPFWDKPAPVKKGRLPVVRLKKK